MSINCEVEILPGNAGNDLTVFLSADDPKLHLNRERFLRTRFALDANSIKDLRSGTPSPALVMRVANEITTWLIDKDMKGYLNAPVYGTDPMRLIFRIDRDLLNQMADLPIELLRFKDDWLVLLKAISAIVHELPYTPHPISPDQSSPLKVLIVRSSPSGLGVTVPPAGPICNHIIKLANALGPNAVHVHLLSREVTSLEAGRTWDEFEAAHLPQLQIKANDSPEVRGEKEGLKWREFREYLLGTAIEALKPGTWEEVRKHLTENGTNYHLLVYLGHGNYTNLPGLKEKIGVLQFEEPDGRSVKNVSSGQLKDVLQNRQVPVPVVLLIGCLTAAEVASLGQEIQGVVNNEKSQWTFGSQGVAQRLVDSGSGVECAIGMRYQIETKNAFTFLNAFFKSLLKNAPGNVEAAVRLGRSELYAQSESPPSWSAPVIFRTRGIEPMFKFLSVADSPKTYHLDREDVKNQAVREAAWTGLIQEPNLEFAYKLLEKADKEIREKVAKAQIALIMPEMKKASPGEMVSLAINLYGQLSVDMIKCKLAVSGEAAMIQSVRSTQVLRQGGFELADITEAAGSEIGFSIKRKVGANALPEGMIVETVLSLGPDSPVKYTVNLDIVETQPPRVVRPANNVVLVLPA